MDEIKSVLVGIIFLCFLPIIIPLALSALMLFAVVGVCGLVGESIRREFREIRK